MANKILRERHQYIWAYQPQRHFLELTSSPTDQILDASWFLPQTNQPVLPRPFTHPALNWSIFQGEPADFAVADQVLDDSWFLPKPNQPVLPDPRVHPALNWSTFQGEPADFPVVANPTLSEIKRRHKYIWGFQPMLDNPFSVRFATPAGAVDTSAEEIPHLPTQRPLRRPSLIPVPY